jgi:hypothetical protein
MMDVSGSMGDEQKELVRLEAFWIDTWLRRNYEGIESRYIVHDVRAGEVDKKTFFHLREDGGTASAAPTKCCRSCSTSHYDPDEWNIYLFHFSDGDNSSDADNRLCVKIISTSRTAARKAQHVRLLPGRQRLRQRQLHSTCCTTRSPRYGGFPQRYPPLAVRHAVRAAPQDAQVRPLGKIYEMVINNGPLLRLPAQRLLQEQRLVPARPTAG